MAETYLSNIGNRIGLMGGTFDPVHYGHIAVARAVSEKLHLDAVVFIPSFRPPHKFNLPVSPFKDRVAMLNMALGSEQGYFVSSLEAERGGPSYTCDTLADLRMEWGKEKRIFFITGLDAFAEIHTWKKYRTLLSFADFVVIGRPPFDEKILNDYIFANFSDYYPVQGERVWQSDSLYGKICLIAMSPVDISSTDIRKRVSLGGSIEEMVPDSVAKYINSKGLYGK